MSDAINEPIRLGLMPPLTGLVHMYGQEICWAAQIAVDEINQAGGLLGRKVELVIEDDGSLPETAVPAAHRLVDQQCCVIIGNLMSNSRIAVADQVSERRQVPYLNFSFYEGSIASRYFFSFAALPNQQICKMIPYMAKNFGPKMYFAGNNYEWPRGSIEAAMNSLHQQNGEVVGEQYLALGVSNSEIDWLLDGLERSGADVFVPYFAGVDQINLLNRFAERGLKQRMAVVMGHYDEVLVSYLKPEVREGLYSSNTYFMSVNTAANKHYLKKLSQLPQVEGIWPEGNGVLTNFGEGVYTCVKAFAEAVRKVESTDPELLIKALQTVCISAPQGLVSMDAATHHACVNSYLSQCGGDGTFEIIETFGAISPQIPSRYLDQFYRKLNVASNQSVLSTSSNQQEQANQPSVDSSISILSVADMAVIATNELGIITEANPRAAELFRYAYQEMIGLSVHQLVPPSIRSRHEEYFKRFVEGSLHQMRMSERAEISGYCKDGTYFPMDASISKTESAHGRVLVATIVDLTAVKKVKDELAWNAYHDPLTGLPNRSLILDRLRHALDRSKRENGHLSVLFIDLDGFKEINDTQGHEAGDLLLKEVAKRLVTTVRPGDTVGRLSGDEFVVLCEALEGVDQAGIIATRIIEALRKDVSYLNAKLTITASIGVAIGHGSTHSAEDMLRNADLAMYTAKNKGRDSWQFYSQLVQDETALRLEISLGLRNAIEKDEFYLNFQPIVGSDSGAVKGVEVLLRWNSSLGEISPALFIPIAETSNIIIDIGRWVFHKACEVECRLEEVFGDTAPYISVNLSTRQLSDVRLVESFQDILQKTSANPSNILLEITETSLMADLSSNKAILERFVDMGFRLAVDDFGTGFSSLAQLLNLRAHTLKIDRAFITDLEQRPDSQAVVAAIARMGRALNMQLVAEGVETSLQRDLISALGIHLTQGFYFHRPMNESAVFRLLSDHHNSLEIAGSPLSFLIYISRPVDDAQTEQFQQIAEKATYSNRLVGVTGRLILLDGAFIQYLEGKEIIINQLFQKICHDTRHTDVTLLMNGNIDQRLFMDWYMGFHRLDKSYLLNAAGVKTGKYDLFNYYREHPEMSCTLFEAIATQVN
ncbi:EAL domain-containing protein [Nitrincola schmidtii]|uniref:EAL domain-containing protein n=1 Tax=Nitrincola schmidtii TaxID=1730894 RepID=UPI00197F2ED3|nr:EAL domain-containing protein [Nitrincola schmidtii]